MQQLPCITEGVIVYYINYWSDYSCCVFTNHFK